MDYPKRAEMLRQLQSAVAGSNGELTELCRDLVTAKEDGRIKLFVHYKALGLRRELPGLLSAGDYSPVECEGAQADHLFAFVRRMGDTSVLVAVPRLLASLISDSCHDAARRSGVAGYALRTSRRGFGVTNGGISSPASRYR